jgi:hypothetical protein
MPPWNTDGNMVIATGKHGREGNRE